MRSFAGRQKTCQKKRMHKKRHGQKIMIKKRSQRAHTKKTKLRGQQQEPKQRERMQGKPLRIFFVIYTPTDVKV
jgi:hypothetical protein